MALDYHRRMIFKKMQNLTALIYKDHVSHSICNLILRKKGNNLFYNAMTQRKKKTVRSELKWENFLIREIYYTKTKLALKSKY